MEGKREGAHNVDNMDEEAKIVFSECDFCGEEFFQEHSESYAYTCFHKFCQGCSSLILAEKMKNATNCSKCSSRGFDLDAAFGENCRCGSCPFFDVCGGQSRENSNNNGTQGTQPPVVLDYEQQPSTSKRMRLELDHKAQPTSLFAKNRKNVLLTNLIFVGTKEKEGYIDNDAEIAASSAYMPSDPVLNSIEEFSCPICFTDVPPGEGLILYECLHLFCKACLTSYIRSLEGPQVLCPFVSEGHHGTTSSSTVCSCDMPLNDREIRGLVLPHEYDKILERRFALAELTIEDSFHCRSIDCQAWFEVEPGVRGSFECTLCRSVNCLDCKAVHENLSCVEYKEKLNQDEWDIKTQKLMQKKIASGLVKRCPTCRVLIEKNGGCSHMYCTVCKRKFSWNKAVTLSSPNVATPIKKTRPAKRRHN